MKRWFDIKSEAGIPTVSIRGIIGEWGVTDREFIRDVMALGDIDMLNVEINSRGGDTDHGLSIYNFLRSHKALVSVKVTGIAASAASIIAMAADEIIMPANSLMMVHNPWTFAMGNADDLEKVADDLRKFETALQETYMARTGKTSDEIKAILAAETWLTATEAVELGFADRVESLERPAAQSFAESFGIPSDTFGAVLAMAQPDKESAQPEAIAATVAVIEPVTDDAPDDKTDAAAIVDLCVKAGVPAIAANLIRANASIESAGLAIIEARAAEDEKKAVDRNISPKIDENKDQNARASWDVAFTKVKR